MRKLLPLWGLCALVFCVDVARASDPVGVYALVDQVVMEPSESQPERIILHGAFAVSNRGDRNLYHPAQNGWLYFKLPTEKPELARKEWEDLKRMAGSNQVIAFGSRYAESHPTLRTGPDSERGQPDAYPLGFGLNAFRRDVQYPPVKQLLRVARPAGAQFQAGKVTLTARNIAREGADAKYHFEIQNASGQTEASGPLPSGDKTTTWRPNMTIRDGEKYTWRVWSEIGQERGPVATATFGSKESK